MPNNCIQKYSMPKYCDFSIQALVVKIKSNVSRRQMKQRLSYYQEILVWCATLEPKCKKLSKTKILTKNVHFLAVF